MFVEFCKNGRFKAPLGRPDCFEKFNRTIMIFKTIKLLPIKNVILAYALNKKIEKKNDYRKIPCQH
jgi:hypothetical protein